MRAIFLVSYLISTIAAQTNITEIWGSGRKTAQPGELPFLVALVTNDNELLCAGSILKPQWVLTSGYCLIVRQPDEISVVDGDNNYREVEFVVTYPDFPEFDLGLLKVTEPFQWSDFVQPVAMGNIFIFDEVLAIGWDLIGRSTLTYVKQVCNDRCRCPKMTVCASNQEDEECWALMGGGLIDSRSGRLVGILTTNSSCGARTTNFVYTKVHTHFSWIYTTTLN